MLRTPRISLAPSSSTTVYATNSITGATIAGTSVLCSSGVNVAQMELMDDEGGPRRPGMHYCGHYKRRWSCSGQIPAHTPITFANGVNASSGYFWTAVAVSGDAAYNDLYQYWCSSAGLGSAASVYGPIGNPINGLPSVGSGSSGGFIPPVTSYPELIERGLRALLPGIKAAGGVSLINSIYELKDFRSLPRTINNIKRLLNFRRNSKFNLLTLARKWPKQTLKDIIRLSADVYLQKEFNISPLLSDIHGVKTALLDVRSELNRLIKNASRPITSHWSVELPGFMNDNHSASANATSDFVSRPISYSRNVYYSRKKFNVTLEYSYLLPSWVSQDSLLPAFMDRVGISLNPAIIWNAIPWSFVVDWVLGIGRWLDQFKRRVIEPQLHIRGCCASVNLARDISVSASGIGQTIASAVLHEESYTRIPIVTMRNSLKASGLSSHELNLLVALLLTR